MRKGRVGKQTTNFSLFLLSSKISPKTTEILANVLPVLLLFVSINLIAQRSPVKLGIRFLLGGGGVFGFGNEEGGAPVSHRLLRHLAGQLLSGNANIISGASESFSQSPPKQGGLPAVQGRAAAPHSAPSAHGLERLEGARVYL